MLIDEIRNDLKDAMKAQDKLRTSTLRLLISAVRNKEIDSGQQLSDEDLLSVLSTEVKKRRESVEEYTKANRNELAQKEQKEIEILQKYMPEQLSDEEVKGLVEDAVKQSGAVSKKDMGKVMQILMPKVKGKADGRKVSQLVNEKLNEN